MNHLSKQRASFGLWQGGILPSQIPVRIESLGKRNKLRVSASNIPGGGFVAINGDITPTGGGPVSTPEPSGIVGLIAVGALGAASLRRRG